MTMIARHGGDSHYVRPDFTYRTSVLQPIVGYQPQADVMAVAANFTLGPAGAMTITDDGLSGLTGSGKFAMWWATMKAKLAAKLSGALPVLSTPAPAPMPTDPASMAAQQVAPDMAGRLAAAIAIGSSGRGPSLQRAMRRMGNGRVASLYWAR